MKVTKKSFKSLSLSFLKSGIWLIPLLFVIDIVSKLGMEKWLLGEPNHSVTIIPNFFEFDLLYNTGAAWGIFAGMDWLLVTISAVAGIAMTGYLIYGIKFHKLTPFTKYALCCTIPGAFGNLIDRAFYPHGVIDFLEFTFGSYQFPTFNVADMCLVIGIIILIVGLIIETIEDSKASKAHTSKSTSSAEKQNETTSSNETKDGGKKDENN